MKRYALLLCLALCACGSPDVDYHTVSHEQMTAMAGRWVWGHTEWDERFGEIHKADIYLHSYETYGTDECFQATLRHEEKHAEDGDWHKGYDHTEPECAWIWHPVEP